MRVYLQVRGITNLELIFETTSENFDFLKEREGSTIEFSCCGTNQCFGCKLGLHQLLRVEATIAEPINKEIGENVLERMLDQAGYAG